MLSLLGGLLQLVVAETARHLQERQDRVAGSLARRRRGDAVPLVVGVLDGAAALGFRDGLGHGIGEVVGIEKRHPLHVAGCTADGLDQRALGPQEALLVRVEDCHQ